MSAEFIPYGKNPGNATQDQAFLLGVGEAKRYFSSDSARQCEPTDYAVANGALKIDDSNFCWWWLRSPGYYHESAAIVYSDGSTDDEHGTAVHDVDTGVRPVLWIDLNS